MKKYETVVVYDGSLAEDIIAQEQKKIEELLKKEGSVVSNDIWGKRDLAYPINGKKTGFYSFFIHEYAGNAVELVSDFFRYNDNVLRHLTVVHEDAPVSPKKVETPAEGDK